MFRNKAHELDFQFFQAQVLAVHSTSNGLIHPLNNINNFSYNHFVGVSHG